MLGLLKEHKDLANSKRWCVVTIPGSTDTGRSYRYMRFSRPQLVALVGVGTGPNF